MQVHWGYADPSLAPGEDAARRRAFEATRVAIAQRMQELLALPLDTLGDAALLAALLAIGSR